MKIAASRVKNSVGPLCQSKKRTNLIIGISISFFASIVIILCLEIIIRLKPVLYCRGYKPSKNDKIVYELYPGYTIRSLQARISSQGLNDRYFSFEKSSDTFRIAFVGDSTSFGWKVGPGNSFPKILEKLLNKQKVGKFETINFSVPGYNIAQEYEVIKEKVIKFHPDMVILVFCENDTHICNFFKPDITLLNYLYNKSYFFHFLLRGINLLISRRSDSSYAKKWWFLFKKKILGMFYNEHPIYPYPGLEETICIKGNPPSEKKFVPKKYWYMLGHKNYKFHLSSIHDLLREKDILFISTGFFHVDSIPLSINYKLNIEYICNLSQMIRNKGILYKNISLSTEDMHMNQRGHHLVAEIIYEFIHEKNLLPTQ